MKRLQLLGLLVSFVAVGGLVAAQAAVSAKPTKTTICHKTSSTKNPYVKITVTKSVLKGHVAHAGDIIPGAIRRLPDRPAHGEEGRQEAERDADRRRGSARPR